MACCGNQRSAYRQGAAVPAGATPGGFWKSGPVDFEYTGTGEMTVTGPLSGTVYRFSATERRVRVQGDDAPSLAAVPGLRIVR
jgi:hypothetical protein